MRWRRRHWESERRAMFFGTSSYQRPKGLMWDMLGRRVARNKILGVKRRGYAGVARL